MSNETTNMNTPENSPPSINCKIDFFFLSGSLNLFPGCSAVAGGQEQLLCHA